MPMASHELDVSQFGRYVYRYRFPNEQLMHWCCMFLERLHLAHPLPDTIQNFPIWEYSDIYIRYYYLMSSGFFLISEKCVWHPNFSWVSQCQVFEVPFQGERKSIFQFRNDKKSLDIALPCVSSKYLSRSSFHCSLNVTWTLYSQRNVYNKLLLLVQARQPDYPQTKSNPVRQLPNQKRSRRARAVSTCSYQKKKQKNKGYQHMQSLLLLFFVCGQTGCLVRAIQNVEI